MVLQPTVLQAAALPLQVLRLAVSGAGPGRARSLRATADSVAKAVEAMELSSQTDPQQVCTDQPVLQCTNICQNFRRKVAKLLQSAHWSGCLPEGGVKAAFGLLHQPHRAGVIMTFAGRAALQPPEVGAGRCEEAGVQGQPRSGRSKTRP